MKTLAPVALDNARFCAAINSVAAKMGGHTALGNSAMAGNLPHGTVCLANDSMLRATEYLEELTTFAISYDSMKGQNLQKLRDAIAPPRPSNSRIVRLTTYDENEPWQTIDYTKVKRAIGGDFHTVRQRVASKSDLQIPNRGLAVVLDRDELKDKPEWQQLHTKWLLDLMMLATVLEGVSLIQTSAIVTPTLTWDNGANPDLDVKNNIIQLANATGFYPNTAAYGDVAHLIRSVAYEGQLTAGSIARAMWTTEDQMATALGVKNAIINAERYATAANSGIKQEILGSNVYLWTALAESPMDASNIVRHVANSAYGGGEYAVYLTELGVKKLVLTVENYEYLHVQHTTGLMQMPVQV